MINKTRPVIYDQERLCCCVCFQCRIALRCSWKFVYFPMHHSFRHSPTTCRSGTCPSGTASPYQHTLLRTGQADPRPGQAQTGSSSGHSACFQPQRTPPSLALHSLHAASPLGNRSPLDLGWTIALIRNVQVNKHLAQHRALKEICHKDSRGYNEV